MQHNHHAPPKTPQEICARATRVADAGLAELIRLVGSELSRAELREAAETVNQLQAQASSRQCDLAGWPSRTDAGAGAGEVLRDRLGVANRRTERRSQMSRRLEGDAGWLI